MVTCRFFTTLSLAWCLLGSAGQGLVASPLPAEIRPILEEHCFKCHGPKKQKGDIRFDTLSVDFLNDAAAAETWHDALDLLLIGEMPPEDEPELGSGKREKLTEWIRAELDAVVAAGKGRSEGVTLRRLNNVEYRNTMTDLLGVAAEYGKKLPPDPLSPDGFRNEGETLGMSALQLEYYLEASRDALTYVLVEGERPPRTSEVRTKTDPLNGFGNGKTSDRLGRVNYFAMQIEEPPRFGDFTVRVTARAELVEGQAKPLLKVAYGNRVSGALARVQEVEVAAVTSNKSKVYEFKGRAEAFPLLPLDRGEMIKGRNAKNTFIQAVFLSNVLKDGKPTPKAVPNKKGGKKGKSIPEDPKFPKIIIEKVEFVGHDFDSWPPKPHRRILFKSDKRGTAYAEEVLQRFLRRAWRRPPTGEEIATYLQHYDRIVADGTSGFEGLREILAVALASPNFLYLVEPQAEGTGRDLTDHEIASRLSYFLWSSMPDAELSRLADEGKLRDGKVLAKQVARLLASKKSSRFVDGFSSQWLDLDGVDRIAVNPEFYPGFNDSLKPLMIRESQAFFGEILRTSTSALQFIDADFTMVNAALAKHYGIKGPLTDEFRRVSLKGTKRPGGVLGHAAFHLGNSDGGDSHPIKRAVWIRERLLHDPPNPPPPDVPSLDNIDPEFANLSIRKQMEIHRTNPACNDCHRSIDPWGIALEAYDALGKVRTKIRRPSGKKNKFDSFPVDTKTTLPGGHEIGGLDDLKAYLLNERSERFAHALVSKLLTYSLGRPLELADRTAVEGLTEEFVADGYRLPGLLERIVQSEPFLTK